MQRILLLIVVLTSCFLGGCIADVEDARYHRGPSHYEHHRTYETRGPGYYDDGYGHHSDYDRGYRRGPSASVYVAPPRTYSRERVYVY